MTSGLNINDPIVVAAFRSALLHQGIAALLIFAVLIVAWVAIREWRPPGAARAPRDGRAGDGAEPRWRQVLRISFGLLWLFDGILQAQPAMAVGLPSQVIEPSAASSPHWVQQLVNWAGTAWSYHPVQAGAAAVWIQVGIGLWLLFAARGPLSRAAAVVSAGWGLVVWVFGESLGGVLAPGLSWLTGAPGGVAFYCVAGALIALPERLWRAPLLARFLAGGTGLFLAGMAVLQAWPGRGFWQGTLGRQPGSLTSMIQDMAGTAQPRALGALVTHAGSLVRAHGFAVNLLAVIALAVLGLALLAAALPRIRRDGAKAPPVPQAAAGPARGRAGGWRLILVQAATGVLVALCLAVWVLVQDFGFFGGLGTDPNSMVPMALLAVAAGLALAAALRPAERPAGQPAPQPARGGWRRLRPAALAESFGIAGVRTVLSASAAGVIVLGAIPMAAAQASPGAAPILARAIDGSAAPLHTPAPAFALTDQDGRRVSLASLRGKAVLLTFLDPVCVTDCPLLAQEFRQAGVLLGADSGKVELVAVNLNPLYSSTAYTRAFDRQERLARVPDWLFLTGSPAQLHPVWRSYGVASQTLPAGSMLGHSDAAFVISPAGRLREELDFDPGPGTAATQSSFATELAAAARAALGASS
ncbi:MAG TPA: SCO family protein [Streptosporangiaceae bacterium]